MKHRTSAAVVLLAALAGPAAARAPVEPAFFCRPASPSWQIRCEVTGWPWGASAPVFEVYAQSSSMTYNTDIDSGLIVYMSRGRIRCPFAVVMKTWWGGRLIVTVHQYDAAGRRAD